MPLYWPFVNPFTLKHLHMLRHIARGTQWLVTHPDPTKQSLFASSLSHLMHHMQPLVSSWSLSFLCLPLETRSLTQTYTTAQISPLVPSPALAIDHHRFPSNLHIQRPSNHLRAQVPCTWLMLVKTCIMQSTCDNPINLEPTTILILTISNMVSPNTSHIDSTCNT